MQKPLKRFTQCGSLTTLFIVFVITFSLSSTALTTFGINKSPSNVQPATPPRNYHKMLKYLKCQQEASKACFGNL